MILKAKQNLAFIILGFITILAILYNFLIHNYLSIFYVCVITSLAFFILRREQHKMQEEFIQVSDMIANMINQEIIKEYPINEDYITSKIYHQLLRLHALHLQQQTDIQSDRDEIRLLINDIAHQMRTPLANMLLFQELLETEPMNEAQISYIDSLKKATESITFLSESFIKMSRIEGKIIQLKMIEQSFIKTLHEAIDANMEKAEQQHNHIQFDQQEDIVMEHDRQWMREAISNMLDNAIKYSNSNEAIQLFIVNTDMFLQLQIQNSGVRILKEEEHRIFKRFYRGTHTNKQDGYGLGLYISDAIIHKHNGFIKVHSNNQSTIFTIVLPK